MILKRSRQQTEGEAHQQQSEAPIFIPRTADRQPTDRPTADHRQTTTDRQPKRQQTEDINEQFKLKPTADGRHKRTDRPPTADGNGRQIAIYVCDSDKYLKANFLYINR